MSELSLERQRRIASLTQDPAYLDLLALLDAEQESLVLKMHEAADPASFLRAGRVWQVTRTIMERLRDKPAEIDASLGEESERNDLESMLRWRVAPPPNRT